MDRSIARFAPGKPRAKAPTLVVPLDSLVGNMKKSVAARKRAKRRRSVQKWIGLAAMAAGAAGLLATARGKLTGSGKQPD
jgi:hypothetical protein